MFRDVAQQKCSRVLCYTSIMGVEWARSADKHGIPREDTLYAMTHAEAAAELDGEPGEQVIVYVGRAHG